MEGEMKREIKRDGQGQMRVHTHTRMRVHKHRRKERRGRERMPDKVLTERVAEQHN